MKHFSRSLVIGVLAFLFLWFGLRYGRAPQPAYGELFRELSQPLLLHARRSPAGAIGWRTSRINTLAIPYRLEHYPGTLSAVFDALSAPAAAQQLSLPVRVARPDTRTVADMTAQALPLFRFEWNDWGVLGLLVSRTEQGATGSMPGADATASPLFTGGVLATVAFAAPDARTLTTLSLWLDETVKLDALLPEAERDAPGRDAPDVPRYPGLHRRYTVEEETPAAESLVLVYGGQGNAHAIARFYRDRMSALGWEPQELQGEGLPGLRQPLGSVFLRKGQECVIAVTPVENGQGVQAVVAFRQARRGG
jgi:hypothetical protein